MKDEVDIGCVANKRVLDTFKNGLEVRTGRSHVAVETVDRLEVTRNDLPVLFEQMKKYQTLTSCLPVTEKSSTSWPRSVLDCRSVRRTDLTDN